MGRRCSDGRTAVPPQRTLAGAEWGGGGFSAEWNFISLKCNGFSGGLYSHSVVSFSCLDIILPIRGEEDFANLNMSHNHHHPPNHMHAQTTSTDTNAYICAHKHARAYTLHACIYAYTYIHARTHVRTRSHPHHTRTPRTYNIRIYTLKRVSKA